MAKKKDAEQEQKFVDEGGVQKLVPLTAAEKTQRERDATRREERRAARAAKMEERRSLIDRVAALEQRVAELEK